MGGAEDDRRTGQAERMGAALRAHGEAYTELARTFATSLGLHSTDATALVEILRAEEAGTPLTPARLAERIGLTSGATSTLLNRLEGVGHVLRAREAADRRVVTLHPSADVAATVDAFFDPLGDRIARILADADPGVVDEAVTLLELIAAATRRHGVEHPAAKPAGRR